MIRRKTDDTTPSHEQTTWLLYQTRKTSISVIPKMPPNARTNDQALHDNLSNSHPTHKRDTHTPNKYQHPLYLHISYFTNAVPNVEIIYPHLWITKIPNSLPIVSQPLCPHPQKLSDKPTHSNKQS